MRTLGSAILLIALLNLLMIGGLAGYLAATGRVDKEKAGAILDLVKHQGTPENLRNHVYQIMNPEPASTATASSPATLKSVEHGSLDVGVASATERIEFTRKAMEQERLRLDREAQELRNRQNLLATQRSEIDSRLAQFENEKKEFQEKIQQTEAFVRDENFTKALHLYNELKPKQVKEIFVSLPQNVVENYLRAMDRDRAGRIIAEFKSPEDRQFIAAVIERIRNSGTNSASTQPSAAVQS